MVVVLRVTIEARVVLVFRVLSVFAVISRVYIPIRRSAGIAFDPRRTVTLLTVSWTWFRRSPSVAFISGNAITVRPGLRLCARSRPWCRTRPRIVLPAATLLSPMVTLTLPTMRRPVIPRSRAFPAAGRPDVAATAPVPVAAHPDVVGCRRIAWVFGTRRRWGHSDGGVVIGVVRRYGAPSCQYADGSDDQQYLFHHESFEYFRNQRVLNRDNVGTALRVKINNAGLGGLADGASWRLQHLHIRGSGMAKSLF